MSEFFVTEFNKQKKCAHCKHGKLRVGRRVYSLCEAHLDEARERWRCWQEQRRAEGKCVSCNKAGWTGGKRINSRGRKIRMTAERWLRCKEHTLANREKCRRWMAVPENRESTKQNAAIRSHVYALQGVCRCTAHNPRVPGRAICQPCIDKKAEVSL